MKTILDTLDAGTQWLEKRGIEDARRNMQWLVCSQLGISRIQLYTSFDEAMEESDLTVLRDQLKRRGNGEPLQHIIGTVEFHRHEFKTDARALVPRPETEELVKLILKHCVPNLPSQPKILDMGTGSGVIGLSLAVALQDMKAQVTCADISSDALSLAQENSKKLKIDSVQFLQSDLFSNITEEYDLIVANLPYVPERDRPSLKKEVTFDPDLALFSGEDGLDLLRKFCQESPKYLKPKGYVALEIGIHQHRDLEGLLSQNGFSKIQTFSDLSGIQRFPIASLSNKPIQIPIQP